MSRPRIDWSQLWYPGPPRPFTPEQMARHGADAPTATQLAATAINAGSLLALMALLTPAGLRSVVLLGLGAQLAFAALTARWLWWQPWRKPLMRASFAVVALMLLVALLLRSQLPLREERQSVAVMLAIVGASLPILLWFLVAWRAQQIEGRIAAQLERERALEMARRLAAAQVEPHFLFNTLASLQHWVDTRDERASALLSALTGYLRATLPLFDRPLLAARDELAAVQRYLQVMQLRLGARLAFDLDVPAALQAQALPPGLLLTLVENAIEHGIEPSLRGGRVRLLGELEGDQACFRVHDDGVGLPAGGATDGVGLANTRERLALAFGGRATLSLQAADGGGTQALVRLPLQPLPTPIPQAHAALRGDEPDR